MYGTVSDINLLSYYRFQSHLSTWMSVTVGPQMCPHLHYHNAKMNTEVQTCDFSYRLHAHHFLVNISLVVPITVTYDVIIYHALSYLSTLSHIYNYPLLSYTSLRYWGKGWTAGTEVCSTWLYGILTYCWDKRNRIDTNKFWLEQSISPQPKIYM